ncbi:hypothetical protein [Bacteroides sp.]
MPTATSDTNIAFFTKLRAPPSQARQLYNPTPQKTGFTVSIITIPNCGL